MNFSKELKKTFFKESTEKKMKLGKKGSAWYYWAGIILVCVLLVLVLYILGKKVFPQMFSWLDVF